MLLRIVDFETTGTPKEGESHAIVEIGWCDMLDVSVRLGGSTLVNPGRPIPPEARAVHHISDEDVAGAPSPDVALMQLMAGPPAAFVAHNAAFEQAFFGGGGVPWICTLKVAYRLWPDAPSHGLQVLRYWLGLDCDPVKAMPPHRALPDAYVTAVLMAKILGELPARELTVADLIRWSSGPALLPKINFGKHKGAKWSEVPADYLEWILRSDLDADAKANARHELKRRAA